MKLEMKKIGLVMVAGILAFSGAFGVDGDTDNPNRIKPGAIQEIPKFKKVKIVNDVNNRDVEVFLNEGVRGDAGKIDKVEVTDKENDKTITLQGDGVMISKIRLALKDKQGKLQEASKDEIISWAHANADKAKELRNVLKGVNVTMERDPSDKDTLVITITRKGGKGLGEGLDK